MRRAASALCVSMLASALPSAGFAAAITQTVAVAQASGDLTPYGIAVDPFNPAQGTLEGVRLVLSGSYTPSVGLGFVAVSQPVTLSTALTIFPDPLRPGGGGFLTLPLGRQVLQAIGPGPTTVTGASESVLIPFSFADLGAFESAVSGPEQLFGYGFRSTLSPLLGSGSDNTSFTGSATVTYTYAVAEPASLLVLTSGVLGLLWRARRRV